MLDLIFANACFSVAYIGHKYILQFLPPLFYISLRMGIPAIFIFAAKAFKGKARFLYKTTEHWFNIFVIILLTTLVPLFLKNFGMKNLPISKYAVLGSLDPFAAGICGYFMFGDKLSKRQIFAAFLAIVGVFILVFSKFKTELEFGSILYFSYPELSAIAGVFIAKLGWAYTKKILVTSNFKSGELNCIIMLLAGTISLTMSYILGEKCDPTVITNPKLLAIIGSTIAVSSTGYWFLTESFRHYHFTLISIMGCSISVLVTILSYFVFNDPIYFGLIISMLLIIIAVKIFTTKKN